MNILLIGSGGREHAIVKALKKSPMCGRIYALPGNGGIAEDAECVPIPATDIEGIVGFAKTHPGSLKLLAETARFARLPYPYLVAASRKRFLGEVTGRAAAEERGPASVGAALWAIAQGADMVRVHDVAETVDAFNVFWAAQEAQHV